jgi:hypothetical protein
MSLIIVGSGLLGNKTHDIHLASFFTIGRDTGEAGKKKPLCKGIDQVSSSLLDGLAPACGQVETEEVLHGRQGWSIHSFT